MLNARHVMFPLKNYIYKNTFIMHSCWENRKMAINVWGDWYKIPKTGKDSNTRINQQCYLHSKMMKLEGWEILDIVWDDFVNMGDQIERDKYIHDWFTKTSLKQEEKGVFSMDITII